MDKGVPQRDDGAVGRTDTDFLDAFASAPRRRILDLVSRTPSSVPEIAAKVGLEPISVRFHLQKLLKLDLIEEVKQKRSTGRPRYLYRSTNKRFEVAYPQRNYMQLASILLDTMAVNPDQARRDLQKVGARLGSELGRSLRQKEAKWDGVALKKHFVESVLEDFGAKPETVRYSRQSIQYRLNNCPFKELAVKHPQLVCEQLDDALNVSLLSELDRDIDWRKMKCMGHGDSYCEYMVTIPNRREGRPLRPARR